MITHVWSMTFNEQATAEQRAEFGTAMAKLPGQIDGVASFTSGGDLGLNPGNSEVVIIAEFADEQSWRSYIEAPAHVAFVEQHVAPLCATWNAIQIRA